MLFNLAFVVFAFSQINALAGQENQVISYQNDYNRLLEIINKPSISNDDIIQAKEYIALIPTNVLDQKEEYQRDFHGLENTKAITRFRLLPKMDILTLSMRCLKKFQRLTLNQQTSNLN